MTTSEDADDAVIYCADGPLAGMHFLSTDWPDKAAAIFYRHTGEYAQYTWLDSRVEIWTYVGISTKTPSLRRFGLCRVCGKTQRVTHLVSGRCPSCHMQLTTAGPCH